MNKILKSFLIIGLGLGIFTACDDDRDSNPTLISPTEFVLRCLKLSGYGNYCEHYSQNLEYHQQNIHYVFTW